MSLTAVSYYNNVATLKELFRLRHNKKLKVRRRGTQFRVFNEVVVICLVCGGCLSSNHLIAIQQGLDFLYYRYVLSIL